MSNTNERIAQNNEKSKPENVKNAAFEQAKRAFERAYASGNDYSAELNALSMAIARSVLNKVIDPQRKAAGQAERTGKPVKVSNSGINRALDELLRGIYFDAQKLDNLRHWTNQPYTVKHSANGDRVVEHDAEAEAAIDTLMDYTLTDGTDLVQTAAVALLELALDHAAGAGWLDSVYTVHRLSKRVYIRETDSRAYKDVETTPIQEVYRAVRRAVADSRAVQTDPRSPYTYISIDAYEPEELEQIFIRADKYADVGGMDCHGLYTSDIESFQTLRSAETIMERMNLTAKESQVLKLRIQGYSLRAIAEYLNVSHVAIAKTVYRIQKKASDTDFDI